MTDLQPDPGDPTAIPDPSDPQPDLPPIELSEPDAEAVVAEGEVPALREPDADLDPQTQADLDADQPSATGASILDPDVDDSAAVGAAATGVAATGPIAAAAWTTVPVAPDPEATEAALAALAARPEVTLEPPEPPVALAAGSGAEPPDQGTPVLLVGGILIGAFIAALAIVILLFRPFDSGTSPDASFSPSPVVTASPSPSPSDLAIVDTPNFRGLSLEAAQAQADANGLVLRVSMVETDSEDPGTVLGQDPPAGEPVAKGTTVTLSVAAEPSTVAVPDLVDLPEDEALAALEDAGLEAGDRSEASDATIADGNVISSDPEAASELEPGSAVDYVVSSGAALVAVPDLVDLPEDEALAALEDAGLEAGDRSEASDATIADGNVISSDPEAASELEPGSAVDYVVSSGAALVAVPDLVDLPEDEALAALEAAGLVGTPGEPGEAYSDTVATGDVMSSDPAAGQSVTPGSTVSYVISLGVEPVAVPDLVGLPEDEALAALEAAGLVGTPGEPGEAYSDTVATGDVMSSDPAAGQSVTPGSTVSYVISLGVEPVAVPDLVGLPEDEALAALEAAGLVGTPGEPGEAYSDTVATGDVMSSDPAAGQSVTPGSTVSYVISLGVEPVAVPDLVGLPEDEALAALEAAGLVGTPGEPGEAYSDTVATGDVMSSDPAAGQSVTPGSTVSYVISLGVEPVAVPDLVGLPEDEALAALEAAGLVGTPGEPGEAYSDTVATGDVMSSDPAAGQSVTPGSTVSYVISLGVEPVAVPDLVGLPEDEALAALEAAGLVGTPGEPGEAYSDTVATGDVMSSDPAAGQSVTPGSTVSYVISLGVEPVAVPDLVGLPEDEALAALEAAGLVGTPGEPGEAYSDTVATGDVMSSDPAAGQSVTPGSTVSYVISLGVEPVAVPDLVGLPEDEALAALEAAGLVGTPGEPGEAYSDTVATGDVMSSDPAAGQSVTPGSTVSYVISLGVEPVAVPDLVGLPEDEALAALEAAGLVGTPGEPGEAYSDTVATGDVMSSDPAAGQSVTPGSTVSYVISLGVEPVAVPDLVGLPEDEALAALEAAGLVGTPGEPGEAYSDTVATGDVMSSDPAAGQSVTPGSTVSYVISLGVEPVAVPDLVGLPEDEALAALEAAGLVGTPGEPGEAYSDTVATGDVMSSDPAAGQSVTPGSTVSYVISLGVEPVAVPDLVGLPEDEALAALEAAGLVGTPGEPGEAYSDTVATGDVMSSDPAAGQSVTPGSTVSYVISLGVEPVAVPDLVGLPEDEALAALEAAGLVGTPGEPGEAYSDTVATGDVMSSDPAAGQSVTPGSTVSYVISLGVEPVAVPDLVGLPEDEALAALEAAGLVGTPGEPGEAYSDTVATGDVMSSDPAAGQSVTPGSTVSYVISLGVEPVAVPDLVGLPEDEALAALEAAGLVGTPGEPGEAYSDTVATGDVMSSDPAAGQSVTPGSTVSYVISLGVEPVAVPDLVGLPEDEALAALEAAGLVGTPGEPGEAYSDTVATGDVMSSDPAAGQSVTPGSTVSYVISLGVEPVAVPDLVGLPEDEALAALEAAGLVGTPGEPGEAYSDTVATGDVMSSDPAAGQSVTPGSTVSYVISLGVEPVAVPDLVGLPEDEALAALEAAGLVGTPGEPGEAYSDTVATGDVMSSDPAAGQSVTPGSTVSYVISLGVEPVAVPDLVGLPEDEALAALEAAGLVGTPGEPGEAYSDTVATGDVMSSDPAAGQSVTPGSTVSYVISLGVEPVAVPDLVGLPEDEALAALEAAGLVGTPGEPGEAYSDTVATGDVMSSDPAAGQSVTPGSTVSYVISLGVEPVAVPDLVGLPEDEALAALEAAGLVGTPGEPGEAYSDTVATGDVMSSDPAAGQSVTPGSTVSYVISLGVEPVAVPDLVGLPEDEALAALEAAGLVGTPGEPGEAYSDTVATGDVMSSDPAAGQSVTPGSTVSYVISLGVEPVAVPDLVGLPEDEALAALEAAGLVGTPGEPGEAYSDTVATGDVMSSDPAAGQSVTPGSTVSYVISLGVEPVAVPDLVGLPEDEALAALEAAGLVGTPGEPGEAYSDTVATGDVMSSDPAAGQSVTPGSTVSYVISLGVEPLVIVPGVKGQTQEEATETLAGAGLTVGVTVEQSHEKIPAGSVIKTDPAVDTEVETSTPVILYVSTGSSLATVPDVKGLPTDEASTAISDAGLVVGDTLEKSHDTIPAGSVIKTDPAAGSEVDAGSAVSLYVSTGVKQVSVPDILGLGRSAAETAISDAGLSVGEVAATEDDAPKGEVLSQDPAAGSEVDAGSAVSFTISAGPPLATVPDVKGLPTDEASTAISDAGLVVGDTLEKSHDTIPAGSVIKTDPAAGSEVDAGSAVSLYVSTGVKQVSVPDILGLGRSAAETAISDAGLSVGEVAATEDDAPKGEVLSQDPAAGSEVDAGSAVSFTISAGPPLATVPDVKGLPTDEASTAISDAGLVVGDTLEKSHDTIPAGSVIKTDPAAGSEVDAGSAVSLYVSTGVKQVSVPDILGLGRSAAETAISDAGLSVGEVAATEDDAPKGEVLSQDPAAGSEVDAGSAVSFTISAGPPLATVPDVKGLPTDEASTAISDAGLVVGDTLEKSHDTIPAGSVIKTDPAAGSEVDAGSAVSLYVSTGVKQVSVPDILGLGRSAAETAISDAGLSVGEVAATEDDAPKGEVLSQDPAAGSEVDAGSAVSFTISAGPPLATVPDVKGLPTDEASTAISDAGLVVGDTLEKSHDTIPAGSVIKTDPAAGSEVDAGSAVSLYVSTGVKQVSVPDILGLPEADALDALESAGLTTGERREANDDVAPAGSVVSQDPSGGDGVDVGTAISYVISLGPTVVPRDVGGSVSDPALIGQLDAMAWATADIRELEPAAAPYDTVSPKQQRAITAAQAEELHDPDAIPVEEAALKRLGLLKSGDDLAGLLKELYGQALQVTYDGSSMGILKSVTDLSATDQAQAVREFGRSATDDAFGLGRLHVDDPSEGDTALAGFALAQGDGTAAMLDWSESSLPSGQQAAVEDVIVPGDDGVLASMPQLLQREYTLPYLEGRAFVDKLRKSGGWDSVADAWSDLPQSTEQLMHPKLYPDDSPQSLDLGDVAGQLGDGWSEAWTQTMGEMRIGVWVADGASGAQDDPAAPVKLPKANAAAGWGGDRLVSLDGPDGTWAIVWQTAWDSGEDVGQFRQAATAAVADLPGAHAVLEADLSGAASDPVLVLLTSDTDTLAAVEAALGVSAD